MFPLLRGHFSVLVCDFDDEQQVQVRRSQGNALRMVEEGIAPYFIRMKRCPNCLKLKP